MTRNFFIFFHFFLKYQTHNQHLKNSIHDVAFVSIIFAILNARSNKHEVANITDLEFFDFRGGLIGGGGFIYMSEAIYLNYCKLNNHVPRAYEVLRLEENDI